MFAERALTALFVRLQCEQSERDRGDVPGWVMITLMTVAIATIIWTVMGGSFMTVLRSALDGVTGGGPAQPAGG